MSQVNLSDFNRPTAAPGASSQPKFTLDLSSSTSEAKSLTLSTESVLHAVSATQSTGSIMLPSAMHTTYVTVTSTNIHTRAADASKASLIYQTKPLELHLPVIPTKDRISVPEATEASFDFYTQSTDLPISLPTKPIPTNSNSGPTPNHSSPKMATSVSSTPLSSSSIAGITLGSVAFIGILIALALYFSCHRKAKIQNDAEASNIEEILESKMQLARDLGKNRWSARHTMASKERYEILKANMAANKDEAVVDENENHGGEASVGEMAQVQYDRACRISALEMYPLTPPSCEPVEQGSDIGRPT